MLLYSVNTEEAEIVFLTNKTNPVSIVQNIQILKENCVS